LTSLIKISIDLKEWEPGFNETSLLNVVAICQTVDSYDEIKDNENRAGEGQFKENEVVLKNIKEKKYFF